MGSRLRILASCLGLLLISGSGAALLRAQEPAPKAGGREASPEPKRAEPARRLPDYFGQIGLTPDQKERIYGLLGRHQDQIDDLEKQIAAVRAQSMRECEAVLTDPQREILNHRRQAAEPARQAGAEANPAPAKSRSKSPSE